MLPTTDEDVKTTLQQLQELAIVVPIGPGEDAWRGLLHDLHALPPEAELLLVATEAEPPELQELLSELKLHGQTQWIESLPGRARQQNLGAKKSAKQFIWFLHADSRLSPELLEQLDRALSEESDALHYFDVAFRDDGPKTMRWNAIGTRFRSRVLRMPFGDQGFCLRRETFQQLGGFDETAKYGEDHLLVWSARQSGIVLHAIDATISTSARKYAQYGWLRTTLVHQWLTVRQAVPQWWKLVTRQEP